MTTPSRTETGQIQPRIETVGTLEKWLRDPRVKTRLGTTLGKAFDSERFALVALNTITRNPDLLTCTPQSLFQCIIQAAAVGLEVDNSLGHAYIVKFGNRATLILGYRGMVQLMYRSGHVGSVDAHVVRDGDEFEWEFGLYPKMTHKPKGDPSKPILYAYAIIREKGYASAPLFDVMSRAEIEAIRARSRASQSGPWVSDYAEMCKKTVLRRLAKLAPVSVEDLRAIEADQAVDDNRDTVLPPGFELPEGLAIEHVTHQEED